MRPKYFSIRIKVILQRTFEKFNYIDEYLLHSTDVESENTSCQS